MKKRKYRNQAGRGSSFTVFLLPLLLKVFLRSKESGFQKDAICKEKSWDKKAIFLCNFRLADARTCVLHKGKKGFGFVLRGAKAASPLMDMIPSEKCPGLQYMDDVDAGGVADKSGIKKGDFLLKVRKEMKGLPSASIIILDGTRAF